MKGMVDGLRAIVVPALLAITACRGAEPDAAPGVGERGVLPATETGKVLYETSFESGQPVPEVKDHVPVRDKARTGDVSFMGEIDKPNSACLMRIPFKGMAGRRLDLTFWLSSPDRTRCAVWAVTDGMSGKGNVGRRSVGSENDLPRKWKQVRSTVVPKTDAPGYFEIVTPSSHGGQPPGRVWIDDVKLSAGVAAVFTLPHAEDFPVLAADGKGTTWLALLARPIPDRQVRLYRVEGERRTHVTTLQPAGTTGLGVPDLAATDAGCVLVVPVEQNDRWRVAYALVDDRASKQTICRYLHGGGTANIAPAVAAEGEMAVAVWESNATGVRGIYAAPLGGEPGETVRLSSPRAPASNPDIVALGNGRFFAAWDSLQDGQVDLYGSRYESGKWQPERRLTGHPRIERHVALAAVGGEVWMAWQAQSFKKHLVNNVHEQRIAVARVAGDGLLAPHGVFESVSPPAAKLMRPRVAFDREGRLWVTARRSIDAHSGWQPVAWCYSGKQWTAPIALWPDQGRWRPVPMAFSGDGGGVAAFQRDNLPRFWGVKVGKAEDWASDIVLAALPDQGVPAAKPIECTPLQMPRTEFRLGDRIDFSSADLPRQTVEHNGRRLSLYWGDMHEHTDMSVCQRAANPPADDLYANQRDIERLDFTALTDHGYNIDQPQWAYSAERVRAFYDAGTFVSLLGEEWTSDQHQYDPRRPYRRYGHRNHIFLDTRFPRFFDSRDGNITPRMVWDQLKDVEFIAIPHQLADTGNCPTDWTWHDEHYQPLAEIFQQRQSFEYFGCPRQAARATKFRGHYMQDAWALGLVIGVIASPDHGGGAGKAGVWCDALTREALFGAFHARHTFGTSGAKISLFVASREHMMGDKAVRGKSGPVPIRVRAVADRPLARVVILRNNKVVHEREPGRNEVDFTWTDEAPPDAAQSWYYVRLHRADDELAWSSPIWFFKTQADLEATVARARQLPALYPDGVPYGEKAGR